MERLSHPKRPGTSVDGSPRNHRYDLGCIDGLWRAVFNGLRALWGWSSVGDFRFNHRDFRFDVAQDLEKDQPFMALK